MLGDVELAGEVVCRAGTGPFRQNGGRATLQVGGTLLISGLLDVSGQENWTWSATGRIPAGARVDIRATEMQLPAPGMILAQGGTGWGRQYGGVVDIEVTDTLSAAGRISTLGQDTLSEAGRIELTACRHDLASAVLDGHPELLTKCDDPCAGVVCPIAIESTCTSGSNLATVEHGECINGFCTLSHYVTSCPHGCIEPTTGPQCADCRTGPCCQDGLFVDTDPPMRCDDTPVSTERACSTGVCPASIEKREQYRYCSGTSAQCTDENLKWTAWQTEETCNDDAICRSTADEVICDRCDEPPAVHCDGDDIISYASIGNCNAGQCAYDPFSFPCKHGCQDAECRIYSDADPIVQAGGYTFEGSSNNLYTTRGYNGKLTAIFGKDYRISLAELGCSGSLEQQALCLLGVHGEVFGVNDAAAQLKIYKTKQLQNGSFFVRFRQHAQDYPVFGGNISVVLDGNLGATAVFSRMRDPVQAPSSGEIQQSLALFDLPTARANVASYMNLAAVELIHVEDWLFVDTKSDDPTAIPARSFRVYEAGSHHQLAYVVIAAADSQILHFSDTRSFAWPGKTIYTTVDAPADDTVDPDNPSCTYGDPQDGCDPGYTCSPDYLWPYPDAENVCIRPCSPDDCQDFAFGCRTSGIMEGYCIDGPPGVLAYFGDPSTDEWYFATHQWHVAYPEIKQTLGDLVTWHTNELGVDQADLTPGFVYRVNLLTICDCNDDGDPACELWEGCGTSHQCTYDGEDGICLPGWYFDYIDRPEPPFRYNILDNYRNFGHEFTHVLLCNYYDYQGPPHSTGLREGLPEIFCPLFVEWNFPNENHWIYHERGGLYRKGHPMPYSLRSYFDWIDTDPANLHEYELMEPGEDCSDWKICPAYWFCREREEGTEFWCTTENNSYQNKGMWERFIRMYVEGPQAVEISSQFEDIFDATFPAVGIEKVQSVVHEAAYALSNEITDMNLFDWVLKLIWASYEHDEGTLPWNLGTHAKYMLGAVGFFSADRVAAPVHTDTAPREIWFDAYQQSTGKSFLVSTDPATHKVRISFHVGTVQQHHLIPASWSISRPAVAEYRGHLHIFWHGQDQAIHRVEIGPNGTVYSPQSLGDQMEFFPNGAFDVTVFNDKLYLVFVDDDLGYINLAFCEGDLPCEWHQFASGRWSKRLTVESSVNPGLAAIAADNVNGGPQEETLYIAYTGVENKIKVITIDYDNNATALRAMPRDFPYHESDTSLPLDIAVRNSAFSFSESEPRRYLYLAWADDDTSNIYTAVIQNYDVTDFWVTRPAFTFRKARTKTGVSWQTRSFENVDDAFGLLYSGRHFVSTVPKRMVIYGRY